MDQSGKRSAEYIASLVVKYRNGELSDREEEELNHWLASSEENRLKFKEWNNDSSIWRKLSVFNEFDEERGWTRFKEENTGQIAGGRVARISGWWYAAASVLLVLFAGYWFLKQDKAKPDISVASADIPGEVNAPDVNRAMITLADGSTVYLDSLDNGEVATQGNIRVVKLANGQIAYQAESGGAISDIRYNTLHNPRGSRVIDMALADGSRVWLNAGSSVTYPIAFVGGDRKVTLEGEGYFEVAHDVAKPFYVEAGELSVRVVGTHFNVNAYGDDDEKKITLLEGSVIVSASGKSATLKPGQQAKLLTAGLQLQTSSNIDLDQVMAWKNGYFSFQNTSLADVMQQISRWYDVQIEYQGVVAPRKFGGIMPRESKLDDVLKVLEESNVHFKIQGRKLIVLP